jgi:hypothetical protein
LLDPRELVGSTDDHRRIVVRNPLESEGIRRALRGTRRRPLPRFAAT